MNNNNNNQQLLANIEMMMKPPDIGTVTIKPGRILWHARYQPYHENKHHVMRSKNYLYTSSQISQAVLHGFMVKEPYTFVELTKLRVTKPIHLLNFKSAAEQVNYARHMGLSNFEAFSYDDTKLFKFICDTDLDGYKAFWDQDQIALCGKVIHTKLEKVSSSQYTNINLKYGFGFTTNNIAFAKTPNRQKQYYKTRGSKALGRRFVKSIKRAEKDKAIKSKQERILLYKHGALRKPRK